MNTFAQIEKAEKEVVRITPKEYEGKKYYDIRVWFDNGTDYMPTRKGFVLSKESYNEFCKALVAI